MSLDVLIKSAKPVLNANQVSVEGVALGDTLGGAANGNQASFADVSKGLFALRETGDETPETALGDTDSTGENSELSVASMPVSIEGERSEIDSLRPESSLKMSDIGIQVAGIKDNSSNSLAGRADSPATPPAVSSPALNGVASSESELRKTATVATTASTPVLDDAPIGASLPASVGLTEAIPAGNGVKSFEGVATQQMSQSATALASAMREGGDGKITVAQTQVTGNGLPPGGESLPQTQASAEGIVQQVSQSSQAVAPQLAPQMRQWLHQALSGLMSGGEGRNSLTSAKEPSMEIVTESDASSLLRHSDLLNKPSETTLPKVPVTGSTEGDWQQLVERMRMWQQPRLQQVEMTMNQEQLGRMQLQVQVHEGAIRVQFAAGQVATQEWLAQQLPGLQAELEASGLKVDSARVSEWAGADNGQARAGADPQGQDGHAGNEADQSTELTASNAAMSGEESDQSVTLPAAGMSIFA